MYTIFGLTLSTKNYLLQMLENLCIPCTAAQSGWGTSSVGGAYGASGCQGRGLQCPDMQNVPSQLIWGNLRPPVLEYLVKPTFICSLYEWWYEARIGSTKYSSNDLLHGKPSGSKSLDAN